MSMCVPSARGGFVLPTKGTAWRERGDDKSAVFLLIKSRVFFSFNFVI